MSDGPAYERLEVVTDANGAILGASRLDAAEADDGGAIHLRIVARPEERVAVVEFPEGLRDLDGDEFWAALAEHVLPPRGDRLERRSSAD